MSKFSIKVLLPTRCIQFTGLFKGNTEAREQAQSDYPEARVISVIFIMRQTAGRNIPKNTQKTFWKRHEETTSSLPDPLSRLNVETSGGPFCMSG